MTARLAKPAAALAALALFGLGILAGLAASGPRPVALGSGTWLEQPRPVADFALVSEAGPLLKRDLLGRWTLVFAGFTYCPELCPMTLASLGKAKALLTPAEAARLAVLFVSVDPGRDTPQRLGRYARHFDPAFLGATAAEAPLQALLGGLGLVYLRQDGEGGGQPLIDHSAHLAIIDPAGMLAGYLSPPFSAESLAADIKAILAANPP